MKTKLPWQSKTLWVNTLFLLGFFLQMKYQFIFTAEIQAAILAILNALLRFETDSAIKID